MRLMLMLCSASMMGAQDVGWHVDVMAREQAQIQAVMDTASAEPSLCLGVDVEPATKRILVWQVLAATKIGTRHTRNMTMFQCPAGTAPAHGHFLERGHVDGPTDYDRLALRSYRGKANRPPAALIIVADRKRNLRYRAYGIDGSAAGVENRW